jgi:hypothetical protein
MRLDAVASAARACASTNVAECGVESDADSWLSECMDWGYLTGREPWRFTNGRHGGVTFRSVAGRQLAADTDAAARRA